MKISCWNIRGFYKPLKQKSVRSLTKSHKLVVVCLLESKMNLEALNQATRLHFSKMSFLYNLSSLKIRVLILWDARVAKITIIDMNDQLIHVRIESIRTAVSFQATFVYGLHNRSYRKQLWSALNQLGANISEPWTVMSDFNSYISPDDKIGGNIIKNHEITDFRECVDQLQLMDLASVGCYYTWIKGEVCSKLDRVLVNNAWLTSNVNDFAEFLPPGCILDHSCYILSLNKTIASTKKSFRFLNMWALHKDFLRLVSNNWNSHINGTRQYVIKQKLSSLKRPLQSLNDRNFSHISTRAKLASEELEKEHQSILTGGYSTKDIKSLRKKEEFLLEAERLYFAQKAKCDFVRFGDRCSKFFHDLIKRNNKRNSIVAITKRDGLVVTDEYEIAAEFVDYYSNLLRTSTRRTRLNKESLGNGKTLDFNMKQSLIAEITFEEIKQAVFDIDDERCPGPNGFSSLFFKDTWEVTGEDVVRYVEEFFESGKLLKQWNHAFIALVPNSSHSNKVTDYRPISCCNVFYKIISKILANRLRVIVSDIVDLAQTAFLKDRSIVDNIHLAQ